MVLCHAGSLRTETRLFGGVFSLEQTSPSYFLLHGEIQGKRKTQYRLGVLAAGIDSMLDM